MSFFFGRSVPVVHEHFIVSFLHSGEDAVTLKTFAFRPFVLLEKTDGNVVLRINYSVFCPILPVISSLHQLVTLVTKSVDTVERSESANL